MFTGDVWTVWNFIFADRPISSPVVQMARLRRLRENLIIFLLVVCVVVSGILNRVTVKIFSVEMDQFANIMAPVTALSYLTVYYIAALGVFTVQGKGFKELIIPWRLRSPHFDVSPLIANNPMPTLFARPFIPRFLVRMSPIILFASLGALDAVATIMMLIAIPFVPSTLTCIIPQAAIAYSIIFAAIFLNQRCSGFQFLSALLAVGGAATCAFGYKALSVGCSSIFEWVLACVILAAAYAPMAASFALKELIFKQYRCCVFVVNSAASVWQFVFAIALLPLAAHICLSRGFCTNIEDTLRAAVTCAMGRPTSEVCKQPTPEPPSPGYGYTVAEYADVATGSAAYAGGELFGANNDALFSTFAAGGVGGAVPSAAAVVVTGAHGTDLVGGDGGAFAARGRDATVATGDVTGVGTDAELLHALGIDDDGTTTQTETASPCPSENRASKKLPTCEHSPVAYAVYLGGNLLYNISVVLLLKRASATMAFMAMLVVLPGAFAAFMYDWPIIGADKDALHPLVFVGFVMIIVGLVAYRLLSPTPSSRSSDTGSRTSLPGGVNAPLLGSSHQLFTHVHPEPSFASAAIGFDAGLGFVGMDGDDEPIDDVNESDTRSHASS